jgi:hypothetical protein
MKLTHLAALAITVAPLAAQAEPIFIMPSELPMTRERKQMRVCMIAEVMAHGKKESYPFSCIKYAAAWCKSVGILYADSDVCDAVAHIEYKIVTKGE